MDSSLLGPDFALADVDQHFYESADSFTRHLDKRFSQAFRWAKTEDGRTRLLIGDRLFTMISNPTFDPVARPGALIEYFRAENSAGSDGRKLIGTLEPIRPEYRDRALRLDVLERQSVAQVCMLPTLALGIEELLHDDPPALHAVLDSFNRWIDDEWGYNRDGRIIAPPVFSLVDPGAAERELRRVIEAGTRMIVLRPAPVVSPGLRGRSATLPTTGSGRWPPRPGSSWRSTPPTRGMPSTRRSGARASPSRPSASRR